MKSRRTSKCIICRSSTKDEHLSVKKEEYFKDVFDSWKRECSEAICDFLFGSKSDAILHYFQNAEFCCSCLQIVRDIGFLWKQIQSFQSRIKMLSTDIRKHLHSNYQQTEVKSKPTVIHKRVSVFLDSDVGKKIPYYSFDDMVEIIYTAILRHNLQSQSVNDLSPEEMEKQLNMKNFPIQTNIDIIKEEIGEQLDFEVEGHDWDHQSTDDSAEESSKTIESTINRSSMRKRKKNVKYENHDYEDDIDSAVCNSNSSNISTYKTTKRPFTTAKSRGKKSRQNSNIENVQEKTINEKKSNSDRIDDIFNTRIQCAEETCDASFITEQKMKLHVIKFHKGDRNPYSCTKCEKKFSTKISLAKHSTNHASEKERGITIKYPCSFCGKRYLKDEDLTDHYSASHQEPNPFTCAFCPEIYTNCVDLKQHTREHHRDPYKKPRSMCEFCGKSFSSKYNLKYHVKMHGDQSLLFSCPICEMKFALKTWLNVHMEKHAEGKQYKCYKCDKNFSNASSLRKHTVHHHNKNGYPCTICGTILTSLGRWQTHELNHKNLIADQLKRSKKAVRYLHVCKFCGKGYNQEEEINAHYSVSHLGRNPFTCAFCPKFYSNSADLQQHMKSVHPDPIVEFKKYKCDSCDRVYATKVGLSNHSLTHKDPSLLFRCHLCPSTFIHNSFLRKHIRRHSEEKNCICETCGKGFKDMDYLKSHMNIHLERKFKCSLCEKRFVKAYHCKMHEVTHTGIKEFICQVCGKTFRQRANMDIHYKQFHTDDPPPPRRKVKVTLSVTTLASTS